MSKKGVENFKRRTWDEEEYKRLALEREDRERAGKKEAVATAQGAVEEFAVESDFGKFRYADAGAAGPAGSSKAYLDVEKARGELDLDKKVGKVEKFTGGAQQAGFHCVVCDRTFQDNSALLDHLNGREHQARLGYSSYIAPSSKEQVKSRLSAHISKAATSLSMKAVKKSEPDSLQARIRAAEEEAAAKNAEKEAKKKQKVLKDEEEDETQMDPELTSVLGFSSFGGGDK